MKEKKIGSYILYAIGEIALIVIGIMIALQLDNWNEERKRSDEISIAISNLHDEFKSNLRVLNYDLRRLDVVANNLQQILILSGKDVNLTDVELDSMIQYANQVPTFNPSSFILEELKSSGIMSDLKNMTLKNALYDYEREISNLTEVYNGFQNTTNKLQDYLKKHGSFFLIKKSKLTKSNKHLLSKVEFINHINHKDNIARNMYKWYDNLKKIMNLVIKESEKY